MGGDGLLGWGGGWLGGTVENKAISASIEVEAELGNTAGVRGCYF